MITQRELLPAEEKLLLNDDAEMSCQATAEEFEVPLEGYSLPLDAPEAPLEECRAVC